MANKPYFNFSGGVNSKTAPLIIKDNECEFLLNYILDKVGALWRRGGYGVQATMQANKSINGLYNFSDSSAGTNVPLAVADNSGSTNGVIKYLTGGVWTNAKTTDTAGKRSYFFTLVDYVFRTNGADVVASSADGISWGTTNAPATIIPKYGAVFQSRGYTANGVTSNRSRVWFSSIPSGGVITWDLTNDWFDVNPDDGDVITALENNGNRLLIYKQRALYRWTFGQVEPDRLIGIGTLSQDSVKTNLDIGVTFFANKNGVYAYSGARPKLLSRKIQNYINAVTDWTTVYGGIDNDHYYLAVGNITIDKQNDVSGTGTTITNAVFCYHISLDAWSVFSLGHNPTIFATLNGVTGIGESLAMGATDGNTYNLVTFDNSPRGAGLAPYTADYTTNIRAEFISKEYLLSYPQRTNLRWIDVFAVAQGTTNAFYDLDRLNNFVELDAPLAARTTNFRIPVAECNSIRIKTQDMNTNNNQIPSIVEGFNFEHYPKEKRDEKQVKIRVRTTGYNNG